MKHMAIVSSPEVPRIMNRPMHLVLPHLYDKVEGYVDRYRGISQAGGFLMQDNSIFELKEALTGRFLLDCAERIGAHEVVVPEVLRNSAESINAAASFLAIVTDEDKENFRFAAVVQGKSYEEIAQHYTWLKAQDLIRTICIPFNFEFDAYGETTVERKQSGWNRFSIIRKLVVDGIWDESKNHHLLGLYNPAELAQYAKFTMTRCVLSSIRSNDSSSAYWHSLHGVSYDLDHGLSFRKIETEVEFDTFFNLRSQKEKFDQNLEILDAY